MATLTLAFCCYQLPEEPPPRELPPPKDRLELELLELLERLPNLEEPPELLLDCLTILGKVTSCDR